MKKLISTIILLMLTIALAACTSEDSKGDKEFTIGTIAGPYSKMLKEAIIPGLEAKGYTITIINYGDIEQSNIALDEGLIDFNLTQHGSYLKKYNENNNIELTEVITVPTAPLGIYSNKYKSLSEIENDAIITIPNDELNTARALLFLEANGLIEIDKAIDPLKATEKDIIANPKNLHIQPVEVGQLLRSVDSADLAVITDNFAFAEDMESLDALVVEDLQDQFLTIITGRLEDKDEQFTKDIIDVVQSEEFKEIINEDFVQFEKPDWMK